MSYRYAGFAAIAMFAPLLAGAQLSVDSITASPSSSVTVAISLSSQTSQISGLQFDLVYDGTAMSVNAVAASTVRGSAKNIYYADVSSTTHRIILAGLNQNLLTDGPLFSLFVNVGSTVTSASYPITVTNVQGTDAAGTPILISDASGLVTIAPQTGTSPLQSTGILNAGSLLSGPVAPGELIALVGSGLGPATAQGLQVVNGNTVGTTLGATQVTFDGAPAPLIYAGLNQVNAIVPYEVSGKTSTQVAVIQSGQPLQSLPLPVTDLSPGIFTQNSSGTGQAAALNQDQTLNTPLNAAALGSVISVYLTGTGQANPTQVTGRINAPTDVGAILQKVTATIGGVAADVIYAGPAPALVAGATQVNLRIPASATPSLASPLVIQVGNAFTQNDVVISIQ